MTEYRPYIYNVTGPCELLVMYNKYISKMVMQYVTGPCELLVMYNDIMGYRTKNELQDPVNF